jgi:hypothetical protein
MKTSRSWIVAATVAVLGAMVAISVGPKGHQDPENPAARLAREHGIDHYYEAGGFLRDRVELESEFQRVVEEVNDELAKKFEGRERGLGFIHEWEREKQRILKERHGFRWRTLSEMNPWVSID